MRAAVFDRFGPPEVLSVRDLPAPTCGPRDVLIAVHAAAVNPVDCKIRSGKNRAATRPKLPGYVGGLDCSGVVAAVGAEVTRFAVGDAVFSSPTHKRQGTYAELVAIDEAMVAPKPASLSHAEAASLPLVGLTAYQAIVEAAKLQAGERILIHAGAGGVGTFAIQLAKHLGATVATTCSAANADFVRALGADVVVDYHAHRFEDVLERQDVVFDMLGGDVKRRSRAVLGRGGRLVTINAGLPANAARYGAYLGLLVTALQLGAFKVGSALRGIKSANVLRRADGEQLAEIARLADAGALRAVVAERLPLERIADAHRLSETGRTRGKIVIDLLDSPEV